MKADFQVGDMVRVAGRPGEYMVIRLLDGERCRVKQWPVLSAPAAEDVDIAALDLIPRGGAKSAEGDE